MIIHLSVIIIFSPIIKFLKIPVGRSLSWVSVNKILHLIKNLVSNAFKKGCLPKLVLVGSDFRYELQRD